MNRQCVMILISILFLCYSCFLLLKSLIVLRYQIISSKTNTDTNSTVLGGGEIPLCLNSLQNENENEYLNLGRTLHNSSWSVFKRQHHCQLLKYTVQRTVACFDIVNEEQDSKSDLINHEPRELHFVFMGDSRIRQQFFNFLRLIPDYDRKTHPHPMPFYIHEDMGFTSNMLGLRVSFKWRPLIEKNVTDTIQQWLESPPSKRPNWILLSMEVHHMLKSNGADYNHYLKKLMQLGLVLGHFSRVSQVIWLNQYPTIDPAHWDIFSEKIHRYNEGIRNSLKKYSNIKIWDSSNIYAEEYIRSCAVFSERETGGEFSLKYTTCWDYIHTGSKALSLATQLLFNEICNSKLSK